MDSWGHASAIAAAAAPVAAGWAAAWPAAGPRCGRTATTGPWSRKAMFLSKAVPAGDSSDDGGPAVEAKTNLICYLKLSEDQNIDRTWTAGRRQENKAN